MDVLNKKLYNRRDNTYYARVNQEIAATGTEGHITINIIIKRRHLAVMINSRAQGNYMDPKVVRACEFLTQVK